MLKPFFRIALTSLLISLYSVLCTQHSFAQRGSNCPEDLVPKLGQNKMWGFVNLFGQWVIQPAYTKVSPYIENKAVVMKGLSYGVIDCEGNVVLSPQYEKLSNFRYGKIWALKNGLWGLLNEKGIALLEHQYAEINPIALTELSWVKKGDVWGLLNEEKGNFICRPQFKIAQVMSENATLVQLNAPTFGVINHVNCEYLLPHKIERVKKVGPHTIVFLQEGKWGVFNELGKLVSNAEYDSVAAVRTTVDPKTKNFDQLIIVKKNNLFGLMNLNGKEILPIQYEEISDFSNGFFRVKQKGKYGFANRMGKVYIKPVYEQASLFYDGQAIVKKEGKFGIIDFKNQFILKPEYSLIDINFIYKYYVVTQGNKKYLYDLNAKKITEEIFDEVYISDTTSFLRVEKAGKTRFFNLAKKDYSFAGEFDQAEKFRLNYALVANAGKWGVIDDKGAVVVPLNFEKVEYDWFANTLVFKTVLNGKYGISDNHGKVMLANEYEMIAPAPPIFLKVKKDGKYGVLKNNGSAITEFAYDFISNNVESPGIPEWPAIVVKKGKYGMLNEKGEEILEAKAAKVEYVGDGLYAVKEKKAYGLMNSKCSNPYEPQYESIKEFGNSRAAAKKNGKWGYIDKKGEENIKFLYEDAGMFINYMAPVMLNGLWGIIDINGKLLVKHEYDKYLTLPDGTRKLYKGGKEFILMKNGVIK